MLRYKKGDVVISDSEQERRLTSEALATIVTDLCYKFNIDLNWCVGICTDSCAVMASEIKGAVHELRKKAKHAKRSPCNNHVLNNSLGNSVKVVSCRNTSATMRKVVAFANASAKRHEVFIEEVGNAMKGICETRWVERHDGHLQFQGDNLVKICNALQRITVWNDRKTSSDAHCLLQALRSCDFIISSVSLNDILGTTVSLSRLLQTALVDLKTAMDAITDTISILQQKRENAAVVFQQLFSEAKEIAEQLDVELRSPRITARQIHRPNNLPAQSAEEYYRRSIYIPLLDHIINDLQERLSPEVLDLFNLNVFLPKSTYNENDIDIVRKVTRFYNELLDRVHESTVVQEYKLWVTKWQRELENGSKIPQTQQQTSSEKVVYCSPKKFSGKLYYN
ncbi:uncharacterized protein LOC122503255 [Leptopilina heterotoma]|uniref:uncharacterized protein LOC122503255 n=1 Tax=Leptopilina heterotoma TaxID=63436 RepID=UPI001CA97A3C|nr:uncharacterized protein LOC122503255 [Leptopilina heterotoma]